MRDDKELADRFVISICMYEKSVVRCIHMRNNCDAAWTTLATTWWHDLSCLEDGCTVQWENTSVLLSVVFCVCFVLCLVLCFDLFDFFVFCVFVLCFTLFDFSIPVQQLFLRGCSCPGGAFLFTTKPPIHPRLSFQHQFNQKDSDINITTIFAMENFALIDLKFLLAFFAQGFLDKE